MDTSKPKKQFKLIDAILTVICVVFVAEAAAPAAAIGNSQYFWWIFLIITFLLPYGLIAAELGTAYDDEGGLYDWVRRAFGKKMGARVAWYYWINFPLWMASLAVMFPEVINMVTGKEMSTPLAIFIELVFIWLIILISLFPVSDSKWILNSSAIIKVSLALLVGILGIIGAINHGMATEFTLRSLLPTFDLKSLSFISVILFNFMGFEVLASFTSEMKSPQKEFPKAIITGGLAIAAVYLFSAFGIGAAIPSEQIGSNGLIESVQMLTGNPTGILVIITAVLFLVSLFGNMVSWSYGVNYVAVYAAKNYDMPQIFASETKKNKMPLGATNKKRIEASIIVIAAPLLPSQDLFWSFFALNIVTLLISYIPFFPSFLKLRTIDPNRNRPFKVSGGKTQLRIIAYLPVVFLIISIIFCIVPMSLDAEELSEKIPILIGVIIAVIMGEVVSKFSAKQMPPDYVDTTFDESTLDE